MRRLLTWLVVTLGVAALVRRLRRRGRTPEHGTEAVADPAEQLREKLAASRAETDTADHRAADDDASVEERRAEVHSEGRAALEEMRSPDDDA